MPFIIIWLLFAGIELAVMIEVGSRIGTLNTILLIIFTAGAGISVMVRQGVSVLQRLQLAAAEGRSPAVEIIEALLLGIAGIMLFVPGFVSDITGILLLTPLRRYLAKTTIGNWVARHTPSNASWTNQKPHSDSAHPGNIIEDAEYEHIDSEK